MHPHVHTSVCVSMCMCMCVCTAHAGVKVAKRDKDRRSMIETVHPRCPAIILVCLTVVLSFSPMLSFSGHFAPQSLSRLRSHSQHFLSRTIVFPVSVCIC